MFMESGPGAGPIGIILPEKLDFREKKLSNESQGEKVGYDYFDTDKAVI
jgi:hypothetical protein